MLSGTNHPGCPLKTVLLLFVVACDGPKSLAHGNVPKNLYERKVFGCVVFVSRNRSWGRFFRSSLIQEAQPMPTNPRDAFRGQSRSPNMVLFDMLGMVS